MAIDTLEDLFEDMLRDVYDAEKQITKALPKLMKAAGHDELRMAFEQHLHETQQQVDRLEQIFDILDMPAKGQRCEATQGLIEESQELMEEVEDDQVRDAGMIAAAQAVEHYEISRYGTLVAWAQKLGEREVVRLLQETLREEHNANHLLNQLAEQTINEDASHADKHDDDDRGMREPRSKGRGQQQSRQGQQRGAHSRQGSGHGRGGEPQRSKSSSGQQNGSGRRSMPASSGGSSTKKSQSSSRQQSRR